MTSFILGILILLSGDSDVEIPRVIILMTFMWGHTRVTTIIIIFHQFLNKHFEPVLVCCGFFLTVR